MNKVLVTGAEGFVGRALVSFFGLQGIETYSMVRADGDITDPNSFVKFKKLGITHVVHLAGKTYIPDSWAFPVDFFHCNVIGTANVLEFCRSESASLTFISTYVYGVPEKLPIDECSSVAPNNPYSESKFLAENLCKFYSSAYGVQSVVIRPFNIYGFGQNDRFVVPHVIKQVLSDANEIQVVDVTPRRDYVFLDDFIQAIFNTLSYQGEYVVFNIGSGASLSIKDIIDIVQFQAGTRKIVSSTGAKRSNEVMDTVADISLAKEKLSWAPTTTFPDGIGKILSAMNINGR